MFEITKDDIAALNDEDLRTLVGLLCEAEIRRAGLPVSAVTWGGNQNAKDGGLDVRVSLDAGTLIAGFVPRAATGFQVKKPDMPRGDILKEMRPSGTVRPVIADLTGQAGAYIIVSATGSTSDSALKDRLTAMADAVADIPDHGKLLLDFYDRNRLATWVRDHAGVTAWVRTRTGKAFSGWQGFGNWSRAPAGAIDDYLIDDAARIVTNSQRDGEGLSVMNGIDRIRDVLRTAGRVVRLVGLSGVGKTRLAEALFDSKVGTNNLDPSLAIYTNVADSPDPQPAGLASDLLAERKRAILIVDNCPPQLHRQLSEIARLAGTGLSVLTVEYDIREDQPEGTDVFALEPSSAALIEKLVAKRFPALSKVDIGTISEFSGGNARIAIALAGTVGATETVAGLSDAELFERLFQQRHDRDEQLLLIGQACSLVYSFNGDNVSGNEAELPVLGEMIAISADELFRGVARLRERDLIQVRGPWRAVLPHAIANRLAVLALRNIPHERIERALIDGPADRLLQSFTRRIGYLDGSAEARTIVERLYQAGGKLSDVLSFNETKRILFTNVAPVLPELALSRIEHALTTMTEQTLAACAHFVPLLRLLAYEPALFDRAVSLLVKLTKPAPNGIRKNQSEKAFASLFTIYLSGTLATIEQRIRVVAALIASDQDHLQQLGLEALEAMLQTDQFLSFANFEFGARSRTYGYLPKTQKDFDNWFGSALALAEEIACSGLPIANGARHALTQTFRGLWTNAERFDDLERIFLRISSSTFWRDGWIAVRQTRRFLSKGPAGDKRDRLTALERALRPAVLADEVRGVVLGGKPGAIELDDFEAIENEQDYAAVARRMGMLIEQLGRKVAENEAVFDGLVADLVDGGSRIYPFAQAMGASAKNPEGMWRALVDRFVSSPKSSTQVLGGFLAGLQKKDAAAVDRMLDEALGKAGLAEWFPYFQSSVAIDSRGVDRLHRALDLGVAPIERFAALAYGRASDPISGPEFLNLIDAIDGKPDGNMVALEIVSMRLHLDPTDKRELPPEVIQAGRHVLANFVFSRKKLRSSGSEDYELGVLVRTCLVGDDGKDVARALCRRLVAVADKYEVHIGDSNDLVESLLKTHPRETLDELFAGDAKARARGVNIVAELRRSQKNPLNSVSDETIIAWCNESPEIRFALAAASCTLFVRPTEAVGYEWQPIAERLLANAPDRPAVLREVMARIRPRSWSGSYATALASRAKLLDTINVGDDAALQAMVAEAKRQFAEDVERTRRAETVEAKAETGRFE
ncbi:MAG: hypothetical protein QOI05_4292 [Bradyrhizobium sp.]|jgi:hypothetical protein|nr:hypothetical protein [Bradyrhizobium sp.]